MLYKIARKDINLLAIIFSVLLIFGVRNTFAYTASDSTLARKFAPIFVLTKNPERTDRKILNPEPVEIIGADHISNVWVRVNSADGRDLVKNASFQDWHDLSTLREKEGGRSLLSMTVPSDNKFAFLRNAGWYFSPGPDLSPGHYRAQAYFNYPGGRPEFMG